MAIEPRAPPPTGPTLIPPTAGTCSTCFYGQTTGQIGGPLPSTVRFCRANPPSITPATNLDGMLHSWPIVADTDWCADGVDMTTYGSFAPDWY
jgi:hypothetical protein